MLTISNSLMGSGYSATADGTGKRKTQFHREARKFMLELAGELGLPSDTFEIRSNTGGIAVSGEVTLHSDYLYVQMHESCVGPRGLQILFRSCKGRTDYSGGTNNLLSVPKMKDAEVMRRFVAQCKALMPQLQNA